MYAGTQRFKAVVVENKYISSLVRRQTSLSSSKAFPFMFVNPSVIKIKIHHSYRLYWEFFPHNSFCHCFAFQKNTLVVNVKK